MKHILSYGIWAAAVVSYILLFFMPGHKYAPYANNIILIYEILCWFVFFFLLIFNIFFLIGKVSYKSDIMEKLEDDKIKKAIESLRATNSYLRLTEFVHYMFIVFVGVFVGDMSMTTILVLNAVLFSLLKIQMKSLLESISNV